MVGKHGGETWNRAKAEHMEYRDITFWDSSVGWVCEREASRCALSTDGGRTFRTVDGPQNGTCRPAVVFLSPLRGFLAYQQNLYETTDGGMHWTVRHLRLDSTETFWADFVGQGIDGTLITIGSQGGVFNKAFVSSGGGRRWTQIAD
jgi:photosystem II stability/assembly factor-like uncharacterized protein